MASTSSVPLARISSGRGQDRCSSDTDERALDKLEELIGRKRKESKLRAYDRSVPVLLSVKRHGIVTSALRTQNGRLLSDL